MEKYKNQLAAIPENSKPVTHTTLTNTKEDYASTLSSIDCYNNRSSNIHVTIKNGGNNNDNMNIEQGNYQENAAGSSQKIDKPSKQEFNPTNINLRSLEYIEI